MTFVTNGLGYFVGSFVWGVVLVLFALAFRPSGSAAERAADTSPAGAPA